ncbi:MAG: biotin transporter BioY [Methanomicrobiales archaeon]
MIDRPRFIAQSGTIIALLTAGSWISIPFFPVPLTLQTLFVLLAGAVMKRQAVLPVGAYLLLGLLNLPVFHNGTAGLGVLLGPTGGYLLGFLPASLVAGFAYEWSAKTVRISGIASATAFIYLFGAGWLVLSTGMSTAAALLVGVVPFIPGDAVKAGVVYFVGERVS